MAEMKTNIFVERSDSWVLDEINVSISQIVVSFGLRIDFAKNNDLFHIEFLECEIDHPAGKSLISVESIETIIPLLKLVGETILSIHAYKNGDLLITLSNNQKIFSRATVDYEAWEIHSSTGQRIVSIPHARLAIWNAIQ
jgi:hypothetical protein